MYRSKSKRLQGNQDKSSLQVFDIAFLLRYANEITDVSIVLCYFVDDPLIYRNAHCIVWFEVIFMCITSMLNRLVDVFSSARLE